MISFIEFVICPIFWVVDNIVTDVFKFIFITDNMIIKTRLPCKLKSQTMGVVCYTTLIMKLALWYNADRLMTALN